MPPSINKLISTPMMLPAGESSTGPSSALTLEPPRVLNSGHSATSTTHDRSRRGSTVLNTFKGFFFRKDSVLAKSPSAVGQAPVATTLDPLVCPHDRNLADLGRAEHGELVYEGRSRFSGEREHFEKKKKKSGESSTWYKETDDWKNRHQHPCNPRTPNAATNLEADTELHRWSKLRDHSPVPGNWRQRRRHSSIREALENIFLTHGRRPSKKKVGKLPARGDEDAARSSPPLSSEPMFLSNSYFPRQPENTPSSSVLPLTQIHCLIPPASKEDALVVDFAPEPEVIPHPSYLSISSSKSSIASKDITAAWESHQSAAPWTGPPELRPPTPPRGRPYVDPFSSNETLATFSTEITSLADSSVGSGPSLFSVPLNKSNIATAFTSRTVNAQPPSLPIDIPTRTDPSRRSSNATTVPTEPQHHPPSRPYYLTLSHLSEARNISLSNLFQYSDKQSTAPPTPSFPPLRRTHRLLSSCLEPESSGAQPQSIQQALHRSSQCSEPPVYTRSPSAGEKRLAAGRGVSPASVLSSYPPTSSRAGGTSSSSECMTGRL